MSQKARKTAMAPMQSRGHCDGGRGMCAPGLEGVGLERDPVRNGGDCAEAKSKGKMSCDRAGGGCGDCTWMQSQGRA